MTSASHLAWSSHLSPGWQPKQGVFRSMSGHIRQCVWVYWMCSPCREKSGGEGVAAKQFQFGVLSFFWKYHGDSSFGRWLQAPRYLWKDKWHWSLYLLSCDLLEQVTGVSVQAHWRKASVWATRKWIQIPASFPEDASPSSAEEKISGPWRPGGKEGGSHRKVTRLSTQRQPRDLQECRVILPAPLSHWQFWNKSCFPFKETVLPWEGIAVTFLTPISLKGLEPFWFPFLLRLQPLFYSFFPLHSLSMFLSLARDVEEIFPLTRLNIGNPSFTD